MQRSEHREQRQALSRSSSAAKPKKRQSTKNTTISMYIYMYGHKRYLVRSEEQSLEQSLKQFLEQSLKRSLEQCCFFLIFAFSHYFTFRRDEKLSQKHNYLKIISISFYNI